MKVKITPFHVCKSYWRADGCYRTPLGQALMENDQDLFILAVGDDGTFISVSPSFGRTYRYKASANYLPYWQQWFAWARTTNEPSSSDFGPNMPTDEIEVELFPLKAGTNEIEPA
jgi:hypothetical protein